MVKALEANNYALLHLDMRNLNRYHLVQICQQMDMDVDYLLEV